jgi:ABC-type polysaccharide/polyol phosphate transport system ATPase subunit
VRSAVSLKGIGKKYRVSPGRSLRLKEVLSFGKVKRSHDFWALQDINLEVEPGTTLGILGRNGAGKSTLLKIISGVLQPTTGTAEVNGRLTAIFSLGSGFNPEFTGRENAMLNGLILGIDHHEMLERFDDIAAFADIGEFMDRPIKTYSSGMRSRLGFAVAVNVDPDILVLDEALSAGDAAFKKKALQRMYDLRDSGTTVLFVSHSMGMVKQFCTDAILLHKGHLVASGSPNEVADHYKELLEEAVQKDSQTDGTDLGLDVMLDSEEEEDLEGVGSRDGSARPGGGARVAGIRTVEVLDEKGEPASTVRSGSTVTVRVHARYAEAAEKSALGITVQSRKAGVAVFSTDTNREGTSLGPREASEEATVDFTFEVPLQPGTFTVDATVSVPQGEDSYLDRAKEAASFMVTRTGEPPARRKEARTHTGPSWGELSVGGLVHLPTRVEVHSPEGKRERPRKAAPGPVGEQEATEAAERRAEELDVDLESVEPTGADAQVVVEDVEQAAEEEGKVHATEAAERKAKELGVDLRSVEGTGKYGRITVRDVDKAAKARASDG